MSDTTSAATQPGATPAVQPAQSVQSNFEQIDRNELAELRRTREQARGMQGFYEKARASGFDRIESFDSYAKQQALLKKHNLNLDGILSSFESERGDQAPPQVDPDTIMESARQAATEAADQRWNYHDAKTKHTSAVESTRDAVNKFVDGIGDLDASEKRWLKSDLLSQADQARRTNDNLYDEGHPLRQYDFKPVAADRLASILAEAKKEQAAVKARRLEAKGLAAQHPAGTSAGSGGEHGRPTNTPNTRSDGRPDRATVLANVEKRRAMRAGGAISSVAG